ncbi:MAG: polysaccharide pyruvyl transferase family protein [Candidatus Omnitrophica bacterium]|nr:polysaccharide pyruvyl transferase family protein [Candidatus Omnitrophota bacterium]
MTNTEKHIWHVGAWQGNFGDSAIHYSIQEALRARAKVPISFCDIPCQTTRFTPNFIRELNARADLLLVGGGGLIFYRPQDNSVSGWQFNIAIDLLEAIEIPLVVYGIGFNQFEYDDSNFLPITNEHLKKTVETAALFSVRNRGSRIELVRRGCRPDKIAVIPDSGMFLPAENIALPGEHEPGLKVGLCWTTDREEQTFPAPWQENRRLFLDNFVRMLKNLLRERASKIYYIGHMGTAFDQEIIAYLREQLREALCVISDTVDGLQSPHREGVAKLAGVYKKMDLVFGMRGHANIIAFGQHVPIIPIGSHRKNRYFLDDIGESRYLIDVRAGGNGYDAAAMERLVHELLAERSEYLERHRAVYHQHRERFDAFNDHLLTVLQERTCPQDRNVCSPAVPTAGKRKKIVTFSYLPRHFNKLVPLIEYLPEEQYENIVIVMTDEEKRLAEKEGIVVRKLDVYSETPRSADFDLAWGVMALIQAIDAEKPDLFIVIEVNYILRNAVHYCREKGIKTLIVQHGTPNKYSLHAFAPFEADCFAAWGEFSRQFLIEQGVAAERIVVTGGVHFDRTIALRPSRQAIFEALGIPHSREKLIVFTTQGPGPGNCPSAETITAAVQEIARCAGLHAEVQLLFQVHPSQEISQIQAVLKNMPEYAEMLVCKYCDTEALMAIADGVITFFSTTALDAVVLRKPLLLINLGEDRTFLPFVQRGAAFGAYAVAEIAPAFEKLLCSGQELDAARERAIEDVVYKTDGQATTRIASVIDRLLSAAGAEQ